MTAPSEDVRVKFNTTVYANVVFDKKNICTKQADQLFHVDNKLKWEKNYGTIRNQGNNLEWIQMCD